MWQIFLTKSFLKYLNMWTSSYSSGSLVAKQKQAVELNGAETRASCPTPVNHWNKRPIQRSNTTLLVVKNCLSYHKFTYDSPGNISAVKAIELETAPKFCPVENANISLKWHLFVKWAKAGKLMRVLIIFERAREEWRLFKGFIMKWGAREWVSPSFKRLWIHRHQGWWAGVGGLSQLETGLFYCNPGISLGMTAVGKQSFLNLKFFMFFPTLNIYA